MNEVHMSASDIIGSTGVALILIAFLLNLIGRMAADSRVYLVLNLIGATLTCISSIMIEFWPFVVLEAVWALAALGGLVRTGAREAPA
jgi:hypothetical protein